MVKNGDKHTHKKTSQPLTDTEHIKPSRNDCPQKSPNETAWGILMQITSCEILSKVQPMRRMHPAKPLLVVISGRSKTWKAGQARGDRRNGTGSKREKSNFKSSKRTI